jgi:hypothetical protein
MSAEQSRRGRPKGSGLDDSDNLSKVSRMLEVDPRMRPTTAIKAIGISDPSTIRRLRDKLRGAGAARPATNSDKTMQASADASNAAARSRVRAAGRGSDGANLAGDSFSSAVAVRERPPADAISWVVAWCGVSMHALSATLEAHLAALESFLSVPGAVSAAGQKFLLNERVVSFCFYGTDVRRTLH